MTLKVFGVSCARLGAIHGPFIGDASEPHGTARGCCPLSVALYLAGEDVPLGGAGAGRQAHLQGCLASRGSTQVQIHVGASRVAADGGIACPRIDNNDICLESSFQLYSRYVIFNGDSSLEGVSAGSG